MLRYVNPDDCIIREDLITFIECDSGTTGRAVADKIISFVKTRLRSNKNTWTGL